MNTFLIVLGVMLVIVAGMAVGVLLGRKPLAGSCGGMNAVGLDGACDICGGDPKKCDEENQSAAQTSGEATFYDATKR
ncbi:ApbE family protein [Bacterioplanes sanyensis]|uniref:ApbE family protein n=1 Tax=Bacterioplanes sanyensis TaxID=1249553 RepID=A0A222FL53_9GAMM|nr:(Na+)-NQR maturation NqrM [Bacterioplanes sanyensis]ASP39757.1 ApbE family protein [Bacterioplanes sanyensis]